jgi:hypothetical protein
MVTGEIPYHNSYVVVAWFVEFFVSFVKNYSDTPLVGGEEKNSYTYFVVVG